MFLFEILEFRCIECFAYALASLVFDVFVFLSTYPSLIVFPCFFSVLLSWNFYVCLASPPPHPPHPHTCIALLSFVLFSLTLLSLTLLVVPPCPKVVGMTLIFTDKPEISFFSIYILCLSWLLLQNEPVHLLIPLVFVSCGHGMQPTVLHKFHIRPISGTSNFIFAVPNIGSMLLL